MSKPFAYWVRLPLVATLCTLTTFSPALAGKFIDRLLHRDCPTSDNNSCEILVPACSSIPTCEVPMPTVCEPIVSCAPSVPSSACCDSMDFSVVSPAPTQAAPKQTPPTQAVQEPKVVDPPKIVDEPKVVDPPKVVDEPKVVDPPKVVEEPKVVEPPKVVEEPKVVEPPKVVEEPAKTPEKPLDNSDPFGAPVLPATDAPKPTETPTADPFDAPAPPALSTPADNSKKSDPLNELFNDSPKEPTIEKAATETPAVPAPGKTNDSLDSLFDEKPAATLPSVDAPATTPAANSNALDPLFDEPATPKADAKSAAPTTPTVDDLFESPAPGTDNTTPEQSKAPAKSDLDDIFGEPAAPTSSDAPPKTSTEAPPATDPPLEDLFGKPVSTEEKKSPASDELFDDIFAPKQPTPASPPASIPATTPPAPKSNSDELDKLFGIGSFTAPSQFNGAEFKTWIDNTGTYTVKARLAIIYSDKVKLLKENGKFTTVSLDRLSDRDFEYVKWVATNLSPDKATKFVKKDSEKLDSDSVR